MSDSAASLLSSLHGAVNVKYMYVSNAALLAFDTIINFGDEVEYIWKSSWSVGKCLYIASRYLAFVDVFLYLRISFDSSLTTKECSSTYTATPWTILIGVVVAETILISRTWAIYNRSYKILAYLVCTRVGTLIPSMVLMNDWTRHKHFLKSPVSSIVPCVPSVDGNVKVWLDFLFIAIFDCNIVVLTLWKTIRQWKDGSRRAPLVSTLYRDGIMYFMAICLVGITNVILLNIKHNTAIANYPILLQRIIQAILSSRIVINVRKAVRLSGCQWSLNTECVTSDPLGPDVSRCTPSLGGPIAFRPGTCRTSFLGGERDAIELVNRESADRPEYNIGLRRSPTDP